MVASPPAKSARTRGATSSLHRTRRSRGPSRAVGSRGPFTSQQSRPLHETEMLMLVPQLRYGVVLGVVALSTAEPPAMGQTITKNSFKVTGTIVAGTMTFKIGTLQGTVTTVAGDTAADKTAKLAAEINRIDAGADAFVDPTDNTRVKWNNAGNPKLTILKDTSGDPWTWTTDIHDNPLPPLQGAFTLPTLGTAAGNSHGAFGFSTVAGDGSIDAGPDIPLIGGETGGNLILTIADYFDDFAPTQVSTLLIDGISFTELTVNRAATDRGGPRGPRRAAAGSPARRAMKVQRVA